MAVFVCLNKIQHMTQKTYLTLYSIGTRSILRLKVSTQCEIYGVNNKVVTLQSTLLLESNS